MNDDILDQPIEIYDGSMITESFAWWESRRKRYNIIVGLSGLIPTLLSGAFFMAFLWWVAIVACFVYALVGNLVYCLGWSAEIWEWTFFRGKIKLLHERKILYNLYLIISVLIAAGSGILILIFSWGALFFD